VTSPTQFLSRCNPAGEAVDLLWSKYPVGENIYAAF